MLMHRERGEESGSSEIQLSEEAETRSDSSAAQSADQTFTRYELPARDPIVDDKTLVEDFEK